ncbi:hypothetical protein [Thauera humireducens]|uniref:hypothetical protein n=1 Tax=Thauera humireducens TaxID=1134435 RepID=UPI00311F599A
MNRFTWLRNPLVKFDDKNLRLVPPNPAGKWCLIAADETTKFSPVELSEGELAVLYMVTCRSSVRRGRTAASPSGELELPTPCCRSFNRTTNDK